ncbi:Cof-type HAD-IIB family hydrolase [Thermoflavimicrobium daqui]|uniref:Cof-type HAD-IIB family hydrolase n=1 Tax=Thermoflavimicrobium daqui TaxID=2137476 RepID=A0A364K1J7_9BACL|nr:Cof-type HAD-IIB family hydrolase [Thermoflavimicrobium daqui]RAL21901.1 Cof-type HAD-IIB family hydrolase [Thermoflavimicrobium daqui]
MSEKYLIACDLDGTLLTSEKKISKRTQDVLTTLSHLGHKVVIATGRPFHNSYHIYQALQLQTPMVNFNGGYVHHPEDPSFPKRIVPLSLELAKKVIRIAYEKDIHNIQAECLTGNYLEIEESNISFLSELKDQRKVDNMFENLQENPHCLVFYSQHKENMDHFEYILTAEHPHEVTVHRWGPPYHALEVIPHSINKAKGLQYVTEYYQIPSEKVIAFGDQTNDFEMIRFAGHGIAMGNALEELKQVANDVTSTNEEDGVALYLEKFFQL